MSGWQTHSIAGGICGAIAGTAYLAYETDISIATALSPVGCWFGALGALFPDADQPRWVVIEGRRVAGARILRYFRAILAVLLGSSFMAYILTGNPWVWVSPAALLIGRAFGLLSGHRAITHSFLWGAVWIGAMLFHVWVVSHKVAYYVGSSMLAGYASHLWLDRRR